MNTLDTRDQQILAQRAAELDSIAGPRVGDFVIFADGTRRRIAYHWGDSVQTCSCDASFYLGNRYVSMSGSLYLSVPVKTLEDTGETADGTVWFFHHDHHRAHNGVYTTHRFRVYRCSRNAPAV